MLQLVENNNIVEIGPFNAKNLINESRDLIIESYKDKIVGKRDKKLPLFYDSKGEKYKIDNKHSVNMLLTQVPNNLVCLLDFEVNLEDKLHIMVLSLDI